MIRPILQEGLLLQNAEFEPVTAAGESVLRTEAVPVPEELFGTSELAHIIQDMTDTLDKEPDGVALAAPQIGISYQIFVVRYDRTIPPLPEGSPEEHTKREPSIGIFINPKFVKASRRRVEMDEGCLSVRGIYGTTLRHERATIQARSEDGKKFERGGGGLLAQIFQHETDHLHGILFIDHAVELVRVKNKASASEAHEHAL